MISTQETARVTATRAFCCGCYHPRDTDCAVSQARAPFDFYILQTCDCPRSASAGFFYQLPISVTRSAPALKAGRAPHAPGVIGGVWHTSLHGRRRGVARALHPVLFYRCRGVAWVATASHVVAWRCRYTVASFLRGRDFVPQSTSRMRLSWNSRSIARANTFLVIPFASGWAANTVGA
jgi:hypothetical protein